MTAAHMISAYLDCPSRRKKVTNDVSKSKPVAVFVLPPRCVGHGTVRPETAERRLKRLWEINCRPCDSPPRPLEREGGEL